MIKSDQALYSCDQIRVCEQQAPHLYSLDEDELMWRAGTEAFLFLQKTYPEINHIAVLCGSGNNAGDGYVLAQIAHQQGLLVKVYQCKAIEDLPSTARTAALRAVDCGVECQSADEMLEPEVELLVDALLGIGLKGPVQEPIAGVIQQMNSSGIPILSLDIPSGLNADTGVVDNVCVNATNTITFIAPKAGMYTMDGPDYCGAIHCAGLQLNTCLNKLKPTALLLNNNMLSLPLPKRKKNTHKGTFGRILIIGGGPGMPGAASLAAKAAFRTGAGSVTVATWPEHAYGVLPLIPEAMVWGIHNATELAPLLAKASVCVIGPGLGESKWARSLFLEAITSQLPMVIDASALHLLAKYSQMDDNWVLTPHPGEAASLLSCSNQEIQQDRYQAALKIQKQYGGVVVLKGSGTIIQVDETQAFVCPKGNPAMATAGMGDVLSGMIAGLCAQGLSLVEASKLAVWVHALAGDEAARIAGGPGIIASDLLDLLPKILYSPSL